MDTLTKQQRYYLRNKENVKQKIKIGRNKVETEGRNKVETEGRNKVETEGRNKVETEVETYYILKHNKKFRRVLRELIIKRSFQLWLERFDELMEEFNYKKVAYLEHIKLNY